MMGGSGCTSPQTRPSWREEREGVSAGKSCSVFFSFSGEQECWKGSFFARCLPRPHHGGGLEGEEINLAADCGLFFSWGGWKGRTNGLGGRGMRLE